MTTGRRLPDTDARHLPAGWQAGDYWRVLQADGTPARPEQVTGGPTEHYAENLTGQVWGVVTPLGQFAFLTLHTVREEDDGTISIRPGDGSSNSVLVEGPQGTTWHGYVEHGVWSEC